MKIILKEFKTYAYHGYYEQERLVGHWFEVNADIYTKDFTTEDDLNNTLNYESIYSIIDTQMKNTCHLIETLLDNILQDIQQFEMVEKAEIEILKLNPILMPHLKKIGIKKEYCRN